MCPSIHQAPPSHRTVWESGTLAGAAPSRYRTVATGQALQPVEREREREREGERGREGEGGRGRERDEEREGGKERGRERREGGRGESVWKEEKRGVISSPINDHTTVLQTTSPGSVLHA